MVQNQTYPLQSAVKKACRARLPDFSGTMIRVEE